MLWRNIKWRFHNSLTIVITILQPMLWLVLYSAIAGQFMKEIGINNYTAFILPGLIILVSFSCCSSGGIMNYIMKAEGSFYRILISPINRSSIILAQILESILCTFLEIIIMFLVSFLFSVKIATGFVGICIIILIIFMTTFFIAGFSISISLSLPNEVVYETVMNAIVLPIFFVSTALFPAQNLNGGLAIAINLNPFTYIINLLRILILQGDIVVQNIIFVFILLIILCFLSFIFALYRLRKQTDL